MSLQIDQSGKIEDTSMATVVAVSNSTKFSDEIFRLINKKAGGYLKIGLPPTNRYSGPSFVKNTLPKKRKMSR